MLELDVFQLTNTQIDQEDEEGNYYMKDCDITPRVFMSIDSFGRYIDYDGLEYTSFYSGGMEFISMLTYEEFKEMILNYNKQIDEAKKKD